MHYGGSHMAEHTPGPWRFDPDLNEIQAGNGEVTIARLEYDAPSSPGMVGREVQANGRLMASAPVLLEVCQEALEFLRRHGTVCQSDENRTITMRLQSAIADGTSV